MDSIEFNDTNFQNPTTMKGTMDRINLEVTAPRSETPAQRANTPVSQAKELVPRKSSRQQRNMARRVFKVKPGVRPNSSVTTLIKNSSSELPKSELGDDALRQARNNSPVKSNL